MRIVLIPGHGLVGPGPADPGGCGPVTCEADWTITLCDLLAPRLRHYGHEVVAAEVGTAAQRSRAADAVQPDLVLYVHLDMGHGGVFHFPGSVRGADWAARLAHLLPEPLSNDLRVATEAAYPRAHWLLSQTKAPAVLLELVDLRNAQSTTWLTTHLPEVVEAIAQAF